MSRMHLVKRLAEFAQPTASDSPLALPAPKTGLNELTTPRARHELPVAQLGSALTVRSPAVTQDLYVWFEDTSNRVHSSRRGIAGLPECLLPYAKGLRVVERHYVEGHLHLLAAARLRCGDKFGERISALYTAALSVGTVAWIGTGAQYARAWQEMYP